jgi:hypothetical protein
MMWESAYADRSVNEFEENIIWRAADLLGVSSRRRIELRRRIAANIEALTPGKSSALYGRCIFSKLPVIENVSLRSIKICGIASRAE